MLPLTALVAHAQLAQDISRCWIVLEMRGEDAVQAEVVKTVTQHRARSFGGIPLSPVGNAEPIAEFSVLMLGVNRQADAADLPPVAAQRDGQPDLVRIFYRQKRARILLGVGMRNAQRRRCHFARTNQRHQFRNVGFGVAA